MQEHRVIKDECEQVGWHNSEQFFEEGEWVFRRRVSSCFAEFVGQKEPAEEKENVGAQESGLNNQSKGTL